MNHRNEFKPSAELLKLHATVTAKAAAAVEAETIESDLEPGSIEWEQALWRRSRKIFDNGKWLDGSRERDAQHTRRVLDELRANGDDGGEHFATGRGRR